MTLTYALNYSKILISYCQQHSIYNFSIENPDEPDLDENVGCLIKISSSRQFDRSLRYQSCTSILKKLSSLQYQHILRCQYIFANRYAHIMYSVNPIYRTKFFLTDCLIVIFHILWTLNLSQTRFTEIYSYRVL